jgi:CRISPR-associated protein Cas1
MTDTRIVDISETAARLSVRYDQLLIENDGQLLESIPLAELGVLVVSNPRVSYSHAVLAGLADKGGALIVCDEKHIPAAILLPLTGHHTQAERYAAQARAPLPRKKRLWQQIVRAKIAAQARLLTKLKGDDAGLGAMIPHVRSGDPANVEAQAARKYWNALFGPDFRRDWEAEDQNRNLNYGYAVLRAVVARALCAAGLHPSLGLHHHNRYDAFCLASDLVEPFRPVVDEAVHDWVRAHGAAAPMDRHAKEHLLKIATMRYNWNGEWRSLFDVLVRTSVSLVRVFDDLARELDLPEI